MQLSVTVSVGILDLRLMHRHPAGAATVNWFVMVELLLQVRQMAA